MRTVSRLALIMVVTVLAIGSTLPAFATEAATEGDGATTTTAAPAETATGDVPAVELPPPEVVEANQPWTARFMYPLFGVLALVIIGGFAIAYNRTVRHRYEVVN
ncbi:MAG: hypothetical protein R2823_08970 [Acidimicrobiia bacterium]